MNGQESDKNRPQINNRPYLSTPSKGDDPQFQIPQNKRPEDRTAGYPYNQKHQPTSNTIASTDIEDIESKNVLRLQQLFADYTIAAAGVVIKEIYSEDSTIKDNTDNNTDQSKVNPPEAQKINPKTYTMDDQMMKKYHQAWQDYYQKYYENYYIAALQEQQKRFAVRQASVVDSREQDGQLDQSEVQERLKKEIRTSTTQQPHEPSWILKNIKLLSQKGWFWPAAAAIVVIALFLLLQFNSIILASAYNFMSPGSSTDQTIIIGTGDNQPVSPEPSVIIPKINVKAPVQYGTNDLSEQAIQKSLQNGVVHYPLSGATAVPGQKGNTVLLGHSSADFFAKGNYKFIFVQLNKLQVGDLFYLDYNKIRYTYKITKKEIIKPNQINKLNTGTDEPYATLITCDPPGTILNRLIIVGKQVSPNPQDTSEVQDKESATAKTITGRPKTILENIFGS